MEVKLEGTEVIRIRGHSKALTVSATVAQASFENVAMCALLDSGGCLTGHSDKLQFVILQIIWVETNVMVLLKW